LNSEEIKPVIVAIAKLRLSEGIYKSVSHLVSHEVENSAKKKILKVHAKFLEGFMVDSRFKIFYWAVSNSWYAQGVKTPNDTITYVDPKTFFTK